MDRCRLVNPLCPDDLCTLPQNHAGSAEGKHLLGTSAGMESVSHFMYLSHTAHTAEELINEGCEAARSLWPDEFNISRIV